MNPILYVIKPGDTLFNLANKFGVTVQDIIDSNLALDPYNLRVGQQIYIYPRLPSNYWWSIRQVDLLKRMNLAWEQDIMWTRMLLISIAEDLKDLDGVKFVCSTREKQNNLKKFLNNHQSGLARP